MDATSMDGVTVSLYDRYTLLGRKHDHTSFDIKGDSIIMRIKDKTSRGRIEHYSLGYYIHVESAKNGIKNNILFDWAGIEDIQEFQENVLGYSSTEGAFPYCKTREDVIKLAKAIVDYGNGCFVSVRLKKRKHITFNFNL